jgi:hypothetical protein
VGHLRGHGILWPGDPGDGQINIELVWFLG